jgi:hypothetical protein
MDNMAIEKIWADDLLGRKDDALFLIRFILNRLEERAENGLPRSYVLNIDARWGRGKTHFLTRLEKTLKHEKHLVALANAWQDDHADDPLLAVMSAIDKVVAPVTKKQRAVDTSWQAVRRTGAAISAAVLKGAATHWAKKVVGEGAEAAAEIFSNSDLLNQATGDVERTVATMIDHRAKLLLESFEQGQRSIHIFRKELEKFVSTVHSTDMTPPLFVLIDELDRCRPPFAIALLERVKHLFDIDNVVFIVATDTEQLCHAIRAVYGSSFDSEGYLRRFFNRTYVFETPPMDAFVKTLLGSHGLDATKVSLPPSQEVVRFIAGTFTSFGIGLRDAEQCVDILRSIITAWNYPAPLQLAALLPLIIAYQQQLQFDVDSKTEAGLQELYNKSPERKLLIRLATPRDSPADQAFKEIDILTLFNVIMNMSERSLPEIMRLDHSRQPDQWVSRVFQEEFARAHRNSYMPGSPPYSVIRTYRAVVRSAGRLSPTVGS